MFFTVVRIVHCIVLMKLSSCIKSGIVFMIMFSFVCYLKLSEQEEYKNQLRSFVSKNIFNKVRCCSKSHKNVHLTRVVEGRTN